jgi:hypothetical protein
LSLQIQGQGTDFEQFAKFSRRAFRLSFGILRNYPCRLFPPWIPGTDLEVYFETDLLILILGKRLQFAIENGPVEIVDLPIKHIGGFSNSYYGKSPVLMGKLSIKLVIFHLSPVSSPVSTWHRFEIRRRLVGGDFLKSKIRKERAEQR